MSRLPAEQNCPQGTDNSGRIRPKVMFGMALAILLLSAVWLYHIDHTGVDSQVGPLVGWLFVALWLPVVIESAVGYRRAGNHSWQAIFKLLLICLIPPYRMVLTTYPGADCVWLPFLGWQRIDDDLFHRLDRVFSVPMLAIALLILPILAIELFGSSYVSCYPVLGYLLDLGTSIIWLAFALEFILMSGVSEAKLTYLAKNWLNLAIILLPLLAFARGFKAAKLLRLGKASSALRAYRLRGLGMRAWRGVVALELIELLLFRKPESRCEHLKRKLQVKQRDLDRLRERIAKLETRIQAEQAPRQDEPGD